MAARIESEMEGLMSAHIVRDVGAGSVDLDLVNAIALAANDKVAVGREDQSVGAFQRGEGAARFETQGLAVETKIDLLEIGCAAEPGVIELAGHRIGGARPRRPKRERRAGRAEHAQDAPA